MKRFVIWIVIVIGTIVLVDTAMGVLFRNYIKHKTLPGDYESIEKVLRHNDADLLVLGSSVALNSINNKVLEDSLKIKTFNGGGNGQTFPFFLTMLKGAISKHIPEQILLCVQPTAFTSEGVGSRYNIFAPYYGFGIADIDENMNRLTENNDILLKSSAYRLNKIWFRILLYHFVTAGIKGENGHISKPVPPAFPTKRATNIGVMTEERRNEIIEFMDLCQQNSIELTINFTPEFLSVRNTNDSANVVNEVREIAGRYGAKVYYDTELEPFSSSPELFYDNSHININGTKIYTDTILNRLK